MQQITYRNVRLDIGALTELRVALLQLLVKPVTSRVMTINPEYVVLAQKRPELTTLTHSAALSLVDGVGLAWALHGYGHVDRYPGADAVQDVCKTLAAKHALVGVLVPVGGLSKPEDIQRHLEMRFSGLRCSVWTISPDVQERIAHEKPTALFVTLGQPLQDIWGAEHAAALTDTALVMGVGGAIDFLTEARRRAPRFLRRLGLEWLWRLVTQPRRFPRILRATFGFWYTILFR